MHGRGELNLFKQTTNKIMTEMDEIKLAAYNSYKRHMRVFGKGKDILSLAEWEKKACEQLK
jgi:hypothetical protein